MPDTRVCDVTHDKQPLKLTATYARWYPVATESVGYVLRLCDGCVEDILVPAISAEYDSTFEDSTCPFCHTTPPGLWSYTWIVSYARQEEALRTTLGLCETCMLTWRQPFIVHGRKLDDRSPAQAQGPSSFWSSMGIQPKIAS